MRSAWISCRTATRVGQGSPGHHARTEDHPSAASPHDRSTATRDMRREPCLADSRFWALDPPSFQLVQSPLGIPRTQSPFDSGLSKGDQLQTRRRSALPFSDDSLTTPVSFTWLRGRRVSVLLEHLLPDAQHTERPGSSLRSPGLLFAGGTVDVSFRLSRLLPQAAFFWRSRPTVARFVSPLWRIGPTHMG